MYFNKGYQSEFLIESVSKILNSISIALIALLVHNLAHGDKI